MDRGWLITPGEFGYSTYGRSLKRSSRYLLTASALEAKDVSTDDVRIELELKGGADDNLVMAYLFKHTLLQTTFAVNLTCLVPTENAEIGRPERLDLKRMLWYFLHFRLEVGQPNRRRARVYRLRRRRGQHALRTKIRAHRRRR